MQSLHNSYQFVRIPFSLSVEGTALCSSAELESRRVVLVYSFVYIPCNSGFANPELLVVTSLSV